jgi:hypothetical protein
MSATTIKLDGDILKDLQRMKLAGETLTALVRDLLGTEIRRRRMIQAAAAYTSFLVNHPAEVEALEGWAAAPLDREPARRTRRRRK